MGAIITFKKAVKVALKARGVKDPGITLTEQWGDKLKQALRELAASKNPPVHDQAYWAEWYLEHKSGMHYAEVRPMTFPEPPLKPSHLDCSWFATLCSHSAQKPDPNGNGYNGSGNTGTLRVHGRPVSVAQRNDLAFYGFENDRNDPAHVVVCLGNNRCISMGKEGDPTNEPVVGNYRPVQLIRRYS